MRERSPKATLPMPEPPGASGDPLLGRLVEGQFRVCAVLGQGAMGTVYEATDQRSRERFALKTLRTATGGAFGDPEARFEREAKASSLLQHPNIVGVRAFGKLDTGVPYLLMEFVDGKSLGDVLDEGRMPIKRALAVTRQILSGVRYAHSLGMVHRDLKPDNVMIAAGPGGVDQVKLLDFGIVKLVGELVAAEVGNESLTQTGAVFGTPTYMAPEQALARTLDARADLYAIGCLLFEMMTGRPPFAGEDAISLLRQHVGSPPPTLAEAGLAPACCTPALEALVAGALAKKPDKRFAAATQMIAALDAGFDSLES